VTEEPASRPCIACLLPARNASGDLHGWLDSVRTFADAVVALDDGSTDDTGAVLAGDPLVKVLLSNSRRDSYRDWDDGENRRRLLDAASVLRPRWIMFLDADERLEEAEAHALRRFVEEEARPGFAYGFRVFRMVEPDQCDTSNPLAAYRLFSFEEGQHLRTRRLHSVPIPTSIPRTHWIPTSLRIQHLGGSTPTRRAERFAKYEEADPDREFQADYSNLLEPPSRVAAWVPRPPGLAVLPQSHPQIHPESHPHTEAESPDAPVLSVVVIAHDDEATIARSLRTVVDQEVPVPFEVIVVTSGTDRTADVVRDNFPAVTLVELGPTALPGRARNAGLRVAGGRYVSFPGSHVELPAGSLAARVAAHQNGHVMVTGTIVNGNTTWAGTASYFLDHSDVLPGRPSAELRDPPAHCSYRRDALETVGGFPEGLRSGEDTVVNYKLWRRGHRAYRAQDVWLTHHSPCRTPLRLALHHFARGRAAGRIFRSMSRAGVTNRRLVDQIPLLYVPHRLRQTTANVHRWGDDEIIGIYRLVKPLVVLGAFAAWAGIAWELLSASLRPDPIGARHDLDRTRRPNRRPRGR